MPLHFSKPATDETAKVPMFPLCSIAQNATARAALNYNIVGDLALSPSVMYALKVLKTCPSQFKALLSTLGIIDFFDSRLITFDLDQGEP